MPRRALTHLDGTTGQGIGGHNCSPLIGVITPINPLNLLVTIGGIPICVAGDILPPHVNCPGHQTVVNPAFCSLGVKVGGFPVAVELGTLVCGDTLLKILPGDVFIGDSILG
jgi:hypothetical protein